MHATHTCASDSLHKLDYLIHVCCEGLDLCDIGVAITVVSMGYDCNANTRDLFLKTLNSISNVTSNLQEGEGEKKRDRKTQRETERERERDDYGDNDMVKVVREDNLPE